MLLDEEDKELVGRYTWYLSNGYYAMSLGGKQTYLHRLVTKATTTDTVDHINGNKLDNRKDNLRICKQEHNCCNKVKTTNKRTSKYKGVSFRKTHNKFQATITKHGLQTHLGYFLTEEEAALAYNFAATKYHGEYAKLNVIEKE
jgi:hypothetical protein